MADKTIPELQLKSSVVGDESMPADNGVQTYRVTPSQIYDYMRTRFVFGAGELSNLAIATAVGSNQLTISLKTKANADPSSSDPIRVAFRSSTLTSGLYNTRTITGSISLVISSGSTLGQVSGQASRIWVYLIDNAGTLELAVSGKRYRDDELVSTTAEGGAGAADSHSTMYSANARSNVPCRLVGYIDNTQATAGTWASAGSTIQVAPIGTKAPTKTVLTSGSSTYYTPVGCTALRVRMVGGGGGGCGSGTSGIGNGNDGSDSIFGSLTAGAGQGGQGQPGGQGGTSSGGDVNIQGGRGGDRSVPFSGIPSRGAEGGDSFFGGGAPGAEPNGGAANSAKSNTGGGGGAPAPTNTVTGNSGGGAGGYLEKLITSPDASYSYQVGGAGGGGGAGASGQAGGSGGSGIIIIEEFYD